MFKVNALTVELCPHITQAVRGLLENPNEPVSELSYFDCIESVMENSKVNGEGGRAGGRLFWKRLPESYT